MIPQQINFYQERFHPKFDPLASRNILLYGIGALILFIVVTGFLQWHLYMTSVLLTELKQKKEAAVEQVTNLSALYPLREANPELIQQTKELEMAKKHKNRMLTLLQDGTIGTTKGFANQFRELAKATTPGVWLTGIGLFASGKELIIEGEAQNNKPDRIPHLIQSITSRKPFTNKSFNHFNVTENEEKPGILQFHLKTADLELVRPVEKKEAPVVQKVSKAVNEAREDMRNAANIGNKLPLPINRVSQDKP